MCSEASSWVPSWPLMSVEEPGVGGRLGRGMTGRGGGPYLSLGRVWAEVAVYMAASWERLDCGSGV